MKKIILVCLLASQSLFVTAQSEKYYAAMGATLQQYGAAKTAEETAAVAAKFERIAESEKNQWLPYYYAALIKVNSTWAAANEDKDKIADEAQALITKAEAIEKNNSEIFVIKAMIATAKMMVNPMERWQQYGIVFEENIAKAKSADATNPRPYMLQAMSKKNTPEAFGGGCKVAKPIADKANELFDSFKPASALHPKWGKDILTEQMKSCN
jgi:uncharacterized protein (DUF1778 family)